MNDITGCPRVRFAGKPNGSGGLPRLLVLPTVICALLAGCATYPRSSPMPEGGYTNFSTLAAYNRRCFESEYFDAKMYSDTTMAYTYLLKTWSYDKSRLSSMIDQTYSNAIVNKQNCREIEAKAYALIADVNKDRSDAAARQQGMQQARLERDQADERRARETQQTYQQIQTPVLMPQLGNPFGQNDRNTTNCVTVGRNTMCNHADGSKTNCTTVGQNTVCN
jgi:hypothetical protein